MRHNIDTTDGYNIRVGQNCDGNWYLIVSKVSGEPIHNQDKGISNALLGIKLARRVIETHKARKPKVVRRYR